MYNKDMIRSLRKDAMDRLSSLPDHLILKILSFISIRDAIGASVLSSRWRCIWNSMPCLNFENLNHGPHFSKFISNVLSHRNNQMQVSSVNLVLGSTVRDDESVRRILNYTSSHNVQQLCVTRLRCNMFEYPYSLIATPTWDLPHLTTLHLEHVKLSNDNDSLFSKCTNLKNLFLRKCSMKGSKVLDICHPRLSNLTLQSTELEVVVNVVAPQLKNLSIRWCEGKHLINAPGLTSLAIEGFQPWRLSTPAGFHSLEKVCLFMSDAENADAHEIVCLLQQLHSVKVLTLNLEILERLFSMKIRPRFKHARKSISAQLSSAMEVSPDKACAFANAKILKFMPKISVSLYLDKRPQEEVTMYSEIKNYDTSPSAIFPMVSREEIAAMVDIQSTVVLLKCLRVLVKQLKANTNSNTHKARMDEHGKPQVEMQCAWELQRNLGAMMALIQQRKFVELETCPVVRCLRRRYGSFETHPVIALSQETCALFERIEGLVTQLSASKRAVLEPVFLSFCEDAAILTSDILGWMKTAKHTQEPNALII